MGWAWAVIPVFWTLLQTYSHDHVLSWPCTLMFSSLLSLCCSLSIDLFSRSCTLMFSSLVSRCSTLSTDLVSCACTLMFSSLLSLCCALSTDLATRACTLFFCNLTVRFSVALVNHYAHRFPMLVFVPKQLIVLLTLVLCMRVDKCTLSSSFFESLHAWPLKQRGLRARGWNDTSFVGTVYLQLESICHQLIGGVVAGYVKQKLLATDLHGLLPKKKPGVRGVSSGKSVDQGLTFLLSKNYLCTIVLTLWNSCIKLAVFSNHHNT